MPDLTPSFYLEHLRFDAEAFTVAMRAGAEPPLPRVPGCPEWNMADLLIHLRYVHRLQGNRVRSRMREFVQYSPEAWERVTELPAQHLKWVDEGAPCDLAIPPDLIAWYEDGATHLLDTLANVSPGEQIG